MGLLLQIGLLLGVSQNALRLHRQCRLSFLSLCVASYRMLAIESYRMDEVSRIIVFTC
jgi:hypothetical protein